MFISIVFIIVGCIIIFISRTSIESKALQEKSWDAKMLHFIGNTFLIMGVLVWIYGITDTLVEWLIVSLLVFIPFGMIYIIKRISNRVQKHRWILPTLVLPLVVMLCLAISYLIIPFTISRDILFLITGMILSLFSTTLQVTENKKYKGLIITEAIVLYVITLMFIRHSLPQTKPIRLVYENLAKLPINDRHIIVSEGMESPKRGESALIYVFIETEDGKTEEMKFYEYYNGHITLKSIEN